LPSPSICSLLFGLWVIDLLPDCLDEIFKESQVLRSYIFLKKKSFFEDIVAFFASIAAGCACSERSGNWRERQCHLHHFQWLHELK
jgi:hypothetical protein